MELAVFVSHPEQLFLRVVFILALPESIRPFAEHRRRAGQLPVSTDDFVEFRPVEKVVVQHIGHFRTQVKRIQKTVIEAAARSVVPENPIPVAGLNEWNADVGVVLRDVHNFAPIIPHASLMLPKPIKRLIRAPKFRIKFYVIRLLALYDLRSHADFILLEQSLATGILKRDAAVLARNDGFQLSSAQYDGVI